MWYVGLYSVVVLVHAGSLVCAAAKLRGGFHSIAHSHFYDKKSSPRGSFHFYKNQRAAQMMDDFGRKRVYYKNIRKRLVTRARCLFELISENGDNK